MFFSIAIVEMSKKDIVRHKLVSRIVDAYDRYDQEHKPRQKKETNKDKIDIKLVYVKPNTKRNLSSCLLKQLFFGSSLILSR